MQELPDGGVIGSIQGDVRMSDVLSALSYALDLVEGQPEGHAVRSAMIGMRLAELMHLPAEDRSALFYALILKDLGCSTNASKTAILFGNDDHVAKRELKTTNWTQLSDSMAYAARMVAPGESALKRMVKFVSVAMAGQGAAKELVQMRCERGADIARRLGLPDATCEAIFSLDEHWDGAGHPSRLKGEEIPLPSRILSLAQTVEVFFWRDGPEAAIEVARARAGTWFDPTLVGALQALSGDAEFWGSLRTATRAQLAAHEPADLVRTADESRLDDIAEGFARVVDAKSPWTFRHSSGVSTIATGMAGLMGLSAREQSDIRRAGLLHDIGKLGVSNRILDKPGKLDAEELASMRKHTQMTLQILSRVPMIAPLAEMAAAHHERLDGRGYHRGVPAGELPIGSRILAVADMYEALAAKRPYRDDLSEQQVMEILTKNAGTGICPELLGVLQTWLSRSRFVPLAA